MPFVAPCFPPVMMVDDWFGIVCTPPARSRDSCHQFRFLPAVKCTASKPWIEATDFFKRGPAIRAVRALNATGLNKTTGRKRKRLQRFLYRNFAVYWVMQQNPSP